MSKEAKKARKRRKQRFSKGGYGVKLRETQKPYARRKTQKTEEQRTNVEENLKYGSLN